MEYIVLLISILALIGSSLMTGLMSALRTLGRIRSKRLIYQHRVLFFFYRLLKRLHKRFEWNDLYFITSFTKKILLLIFAVTGTFFLINEVKLGNALFDQAPAIFLLFVAGVEIALILTADMIMKSFCKAFAKIGAQITFFFGSFFCMLFLPLTSSLLFIFKTFFPSQQSQEFESAPKLAKDKIMELVGDSELSRYLDPTQAKLLSSIATFQERIVREIMVPRIDVTAIDAKTSVREASKVFIDEEYSRVPVFRETVDQICGVLRYKDILELYIKHGENSDTKFLDEPIESLIKPILYAPETKKISKLLQEFRKEQNHLAIIVDEYGGTEGIVSIEDILEELVGEIEDEYDTDEEILYKQQESGEVIIDAKMSIIDIEKELNIIIPPSPEYDTIGGYIFHRAGSIPEKGWRIHHEAFDLEILSSSPRAIDKVRIIPLAK